jgi:mRNA-degrading endonuclease RelE of RelBE toxin-antitoxin system
MADKAREVVIAPIAIRRMNASEPSEEERQAIKNALTELSKNPNLGYKIMFIQPALYRYDVGRFRIHYSQDNNVIGVSFIGTY